MIAPIMPFIAEEIYQEHFKKFEGARSIHVSGWPSLGEFGETKDFEKFVDVLSRVRQAKTKEGKAMNSEIVLSLNEKLEGMEEDLKNVVNAREIKDGKEFKVEFVGQ